MKDVAPESGFDVRVNSFVTTLLINYLYTGKNAIPSSSPIYWPQWTHCEALESLKEVANGDGVLLANSDILSSVETFKLQMPTACYGRRFAVTKRGYMALVPHCAEVGDRVALFLGAPVRFVVRETGDKLGPERKRVMNLVGNTYVHGIMEAEGMELAGFSPQEIFIR
jgi:hypothetical protein